MGSPSDDPSQNHHVYRPGCRCGAVRDPFHSPLRLANRFARRPSYVWRRLAHGCNPVWRLAKKLKLKRMRELSPFLGREHKKNAGMTRLTLKWPEWCAG